MRKIVAIGIVILLTSCATDKYLLTPEQMKASPYHTEGYNILNGTTIIGKVSSTEIEIDKNGKMVKEISITLVGFSKITEVEEVMKFLHTKYQNKKIEINLDGIETFE